MPLQRLVKRMFAGRYILVTNTVTSGVLMGLGDLLIQRIHPAPEQSPRVKDMKIDWKRTGRMFTMGVLFGPLCHFWYKYLDRIFPSTQRAVVMRKVLVDQTVAGPTFILYFFFATGFLEGHTVEQSWRELREKFIAVYLVDWLFWPAAQSVNFFFVPPHFRVVYIGASALVYNSFLSFMKHEPKVPSFLRLKSEPSSD